MDLIIGMGGGTILVLLGMRRGTHLNSLDRD